MALKNIRVIARRTEYYYIDVEAHSKADAMDIARDKPEEEFKLKEGIEEWKILGAAIMEKGVEVDDLKCLSPTTIKK